MKAYLGLGSNIGDRYENLCIAVEKLNCVSDVKIDRMSRIYETEPVGNVDQPFFLNAAVRVETSLTAQRLLQVCLAIEAKMGRTRTEKWAPRSIDIDVLFFADEIVNEEKLIIPHPLLHTRAFVLFPLMDIASEVLHPGFGITVEELFKSVETTGIALTDYKLKNIIKINGKTGSYGLSL